MTPPKISIQSILQKKKQSEKITMLTAYDFALAAIIDQAGIDIVLVGDSMANVVLGLESTKDIGLDEIIHHAKAVRRGVHNALLVGDMPFSAYQQNPRQSVANAKRLINEAGCDAVKIEWFDQCLSVAEDLVKAGIPLMGHVGLTPQTADQLGGFKVQGKDAQSAQKIIENSLALEKAGCFAIVLECIPDQISEIITHKLKIPTIGIGAGVYCDGQVLVTYDLLGFLKGFHPKFTKQYIDLNSQITQAVLQFKNEVTQKTFPDAAHSFTIKTDELAHLKKLLS